MVLHTLYTGATFVRTLADGADDGCTSMRH